jgi:transcription antitermination factor NusG
MNDRPENLMQNFSCDAGKNYATDAATRSDAYDLGIAPCGSSGTHWTGISSKMAWGGARANSGGPRANSGGARSGAGRKPKPDPEPPVASVAWDGPRWCVFTTHPAAECTAAQEITRAGYRVYLPLIATRRRDNVLPTLIHRVVVARLPGYGFVELSPSDPWAPIVGGTMSGVRGLLLGFNGRPASVPLADVERLQADDARYLDLPSDVLPALAVGTMARIVEGALESLTGMVLSCDGLTTELSVNLFGRLVPTRLLRTMVTEAGDG